MRQSLAQAAMTVGRSRSTILRSIRAGKLSAERDELTGAWSIDMAELTRLFPAQANGRDDGHGPAGTDDQMRTGDVATRLATAAARLADAQDQIMDLRHRLDEERADRRQMQHQLAAAQERIAALLTDQRPVPAAHSQIGPAGSIGSTC